MADAYLKNHHVNRINLLWMIVLLVLSGNVSKKLQIVKKVHILLMMHLQVINGNVLSNSHVHQTNILNLIMALKSGTVWIIIFAAKMSMQLFKARILSVFIVILKLKLKKVSRMSNFILKTLWFLIFLASLVSSFL